MIQSEAELFDPFYSRLPLHQISLAWDCLYNDLPNLPPELSHLSSEQWLELANLLSHQLYLKQQSPLQ